MRKTTTSPADAWGTPEHEAAIDKMVEGSLCSDVRAGRVCSHVWSMKQVRAYQRLTQGVRLQR